jgi:hypothetical protein
MLIRPASLRRCAARVPAGSGWDSTASLRGSFRPASTSGPTSQIRRSSIPITAPGTPHGRSPSAPRNPGRCPRWAPSATPTTTPSPSPSGSDAGRTPRLSAVEHSHRARQRDLWVPGDPCRSPQCLGWLPDGVREAPHGQRRLTPTHGGQPAGPQIIRPAPAAVCHDQASDW